MDTDELIDWLLAIYCQYGKKTVKLDGRKMIISSVCEEAVKQLEENRNDSN